MDVSFYQDKRVFTNDEDTSDSTVLNLIHRLIEFFDFGDGLAEFFAGGFSERGGWAVVDVHGHGLSSYSISGLTV